MIQPPSSPLLPDARGFFGAYGGCFVPEILHEIMRDLADNFSRVVLGAEFWQEFMDELQEFSGRPTPLTYARNLSRELDGAQIYLKREDLSNWCP